VVQSALEMLTESVPFETISISTSFAL